MDAVHLASSRQVHLNFNGVIVDIGTHVIPPVLVPSIEIRFATLEPRERGASFRCPDVPSNNYFMASKKNGGDGQPGAGNGDEQRGPGRPHGAKDSKQRAKVVPSDRPLNLLRWQFAEYAIQHAYEALNGMIDLMRNAESEAVRLNAMDKILDRALGKAPLHIDVTALRHTEIVYRSAEEIRNALLGRGLPPALLDLRPAAAKDDDDDIVD